MSMDRVKRNKTRFFAVLLCLFLLAGLFSGMGTKVYAVDDAVTITDASDSDSLKIKDKGKEATGEETNLEAEDESSKSISDRLATDSEASLETSEANTDVYREAEVDDKRCGFVRISGQGLTESGYYQNNNGVWEKSADNNIPDDHYIHYDRQRHVLTLNNVTITNGNSPILNSGIFVDDTGRNLLKAKEEVYLHIILKGTNTVSGDAGIYMKTDVYRNPYHRAKLKISGPGTLTARGSAGGGSAGIMLQNLDGDVELIVDGANVVAEGHNRYGGYGVYLQHSKTGTGKLTVRGGKLIASSDTNTGIGLFGGSGVKSQGKDRIVVTDSAVVKADGKKGLSFNEEDFSVETGDNGTGGIIFDGKQGTVYGNVTLLEELNIAKGESLTVPKGASLTIPQDKTLANNGTITVEEGGKLENKGQIHNRGEIKGKIEGKQLPQVDNEKLTDATVGKQYSVQIVKNNDSIKWSLKEDSELPKGLTLDGDTGIISGKPTETGDFTFTLLAENDGGSEFKTFNITVNPAPIYKINDLKDVKVNEGESVTFSVEITRNAESMTEGVKYYWRQSDDGGKTWTVVDTNNRNSYTIVSVTKEMNNLQFSCLADIEEHGKLESNAVTLTVEPMPVITTESIPDGKVEQAYSTTIASIGNSIKWSLKEGSTLPKGLTLDGDTGVISGKPIEAGNFTFTILAQSAWGSVEKTLSLKVNSDTTGIDKPVNYVVTVQTEGNGKTSSNPMIATQGTKVILNATPDAGYVFKGWEVVSGSVEIKDNSFIMPAENVLIKAVFEKSETKIIANIVFDNKDEKHKKHKTLLRAVSKTGESSNTREISISLMILSIIFFVIYAASVKRKHIN